MWNETFEFEDFEFDMDVVVRLYDWDFMGPPEYIGYFLLLLLLLLLELLPLLLPLPLPLLLIGVVVVVVVFVLLMN